MVISELFYDEKGNNYSTIDTFITKDETITVHHESKFDDEGRVIETKSFRHKLASEKRLSYDSMNRKITKSKDADIESIIRIQYDDKGRIISKENDSPQDSLKTIFSYEDNINDKRRTSEICINKTTGKKVYERVFVKGKTLEKEFKKKYDVEGNEKYTFISIIENIESGKIYKTKEIDKTMKQPQLQIKKTNRKTKYYMNKVWGRRILLDKEICEIITTLNTKDDIKSNTMHEFGIIEYANITIENSCYILYEQYYYYTYDDQQITKKSNIFIDYKRTDSDKTIRMTIKIYDCIDFILEKLEKGFKDKEFLYELLDKYKYNIINYELQFYNVFTEIGIYMHTIENAIDNSIYIDKYLEVKKDDIKISLKEINGDYKLDSFSEDSQTTAANYLNDQVETILFETNYFKSDKKYNNILFSFGNHEYTIYYRDNNKNKYAIQYRPNIEEPIPEVVNEVKSHLFGKYFGIYSEDIEKMTNIAIDLEEELLKDDSIARLVHYKSDTESIYIPDILSALELVKDNEN